MAHSKEDRELLDKLRDKYRTTSLDGELQRDKPREKENPGIPSVKESTALANVHLCPICQGSGVQEQLYEFRRMQSTCSNCQGEGILSCGSNPVGHTAKASNGTVDADKDAPLTQDQHTNDMKQQQRMFTERRLAALRRKIAKLTKERDELQTTLSQACESSAEQRQLQQQLVEQLQKHLDQLEVQQQNESLVA